MQVPRLPSIFKINRNKRFNFSTRYYDEKKERLDKTKEGRTIEIKFRNNLSSSLDKGRMIRLISLCLVLGIIVLLILNSK